MRITHGVKAFLLTFSEHSRTGFFNQSLYVLSLLIRELTMRITKVDLSKLQPAPLYPAYNVWYYDANGNKAKASQAEQRTVIAEVWNVFHSFLRKNNDVVIKQPPYHDLNYHKGYAFLVEGSLNEIPPSVDVQDSFRSPVNNGKLWRAAKHNQSIIVVSDFDVGSIKATAEPGFTDSTTASFSNTINLTLEMCGVPEAEPGYAKFGKYYWSTTAVVYSQETRNRVTRNYIDPVVPISISDIVSQCGWFSDSGVITSTVAKADTGHMDVLTSVAELPETIASVVSGFKEVARLVRDLKKGQLAISRAHERRAERLRRNYERDMARLSSLSGAARDRARKRALEREIKNRQDSFAYANKRALAELADALADIWMNFRYNIMPNIYMAQDALKLYEAYSADFITGRDSSGWVDGPVFEPHGWDPLQIEQQYNCVIKRGINASFRWSTVTKSNILSTAWELVPLSFVVDWFVNIGDLLTAISSPNLSPSEGATAGVRYKYEGSLKNTETHQSCRYEINIYRRRVISPNNHIGLSFSFDLSWMRKIDALALIWRPIRDLLLQSLKGKR